MMLIASVCNAQGPKTGKSMPGMREKPPNILFILVDDQRNTSLGCAGHPQIKTPNIDAMAENGVRFENSFVNTPICMASRATLFTGLTTTSHGYYSGLRHGTPVIREDVITSFPALLRQAGYRTAFFGKQHVRFQRGTDGMGMMFDEAQALRRTPYMKKMPDGSLRHVDEIMGDKSIEFLTSHRQDNPFFLYMSFNISHAEDHDLRPGFHFQWAKKEDGLYEDVDPNRPDLDDPEYYSSAPDFLRKSMNRHRYKWRWDTPDKYRTNMRALYRMLTGMDRIVGRVRKTLEERGMDKNTIVIYSADNGFYMGDRGFAGKWSHFEQSLRVPLIVYDPRMPEEQRGRVLKQMAVNLDIPCTILDMAGVEIPDKYQGRSLMPLLDGRSPEDWRKVFYCEHHYNHGSLPKWYGVRDTRFTYANYYEEKVELLYDREKDPTQLSDVAGNPEYQAVLKKLRSRSEEYKKQYTRPEIVELKRAATKRKKQKR
jgi:arylsulfatase A-like enzyme